MDWMLQYSAAQLERQRRILQLHPTGQAEFHDVAVPVIGLQLGDHVQRTLRPSSNNLNLECAVLLG